MISAPTHVAKAPGARWRLLAVTLLACALIAAIAAAPAAAAEKAIWGPLTLPNGASAFPTYQDLGVDTLQLQIDWDGVAPTRPQDPGNPADPAYIWPSRVDRAISEGAASGIQIALVVGRSPGWANGGQSAVNVPNAAHFATFLAAASRRYPAVRRWMIWGEPNRSDRFLPNDEGSPVGPRAYAVILDSAYQALKQVSPANIVIGGMTWTGGTVKPASFLEFMRLPDGRPPRLDWFGHNPFPFRFPNLAELEIAGGWRDISDMDLFSKEVMRTYGAKVRLWLSEFTVLSDRPSREFESAVSRQDQARWLSAAFGIADALPSVAGIGWLYLVDEPDAPGSSNFGLLTDTGARKPAYDAFRNAPSARFAPLVRSARRIRRRSLAIRGLRVLVRPKLSGRFAVELRSRRGRRVARTTRGGSAGRVRALRLRRRGLRRGRYTLTVRAARGESVRRALVVR